MRIAAFVAFLAAAGAAAPEIVLVMKTGEKYKLSAPATHKGGRLTFRTTDGRLLSVLEADVATENLPPPPPEKKRVNTRDDRQLGAYARQQREATGKPALIAGPTGANEKEKKPSTDSGKPDDEKHPQ